MVWRELLLGYDPKSTDMWGNPRGGYDNWGNPRFGYDMWGNPRPPPAGHTGYDDYDDMDCGLSRRSTQRDAYEQGRRDAAREQPPRRDSRYDYDDQVPPPLRRDSRYEYDERPPPQRHYEHGDRLYSERQRSYEYDAPPLLKKQHAPSPPPDYAPPAYDAKLPPQSSSSFQPPPHPHNSNNPFLRPRKS